MPVEVILPKVDMDMTHGTLAVWHVAEGEAVAKGAALFDIETDKAAMEVEAPASGRLHRISAQPGDRVAVGAIVAMIYTDGETLEASPTPANTEPLAEVAPAPVSGSGSEPDALPVAPPPPLPRQPETSALRSTPAARAAARSAGIALADVPGTGPQGRIQRDDVTALREAPPPPAPLAATAGWVAQPGPLHVSHRRGSGVPLVMLHGFSADSQSWAPLEKALGPDRALIRIDLPGHGRSPRRRIGGFTQLARMIVETIDAATRGIDSFHLLGHSLGGALALAAADIRPRRVVSLALIAPAGLGAEIDAATLTGIARATRAESLAPWLRRLTANPEGFSDEYARAAMKLRTDPALRAYQAEMTDALIPDGVQAFDLRPALSRLKAPTSLIWGRQDHILPYRHALVADGDFAITLLSGVGHVPQIECPERVAPILRRHLAASDGPA